MDSYDLVVIGGGSGGLTSAIMGARVGARVLLVDRERLGGDCLHFGCVPSKALIASARMAHRMRHAADYGIRPVDVSVDFPAVMERIRRIQAEIGAGESPEALSRHGVEVAFGGARFLDEHAIQIGADRRVSAKHTVIATGSHAHAPKIEGLEEAGYINNVSLFGLTELPERVVVLGGGPIGCEMGQALRRLGAEVTIVQRASQLLPREEPEVAAFIRDRFEREGIRILLSTNPVRIEPDKTVVLQDEMLSCAEILVAVGRRSTLEGLGLEAAGVATNERGIVVNGALQTSQAHIYAVGDCNGGPQFTHWAEQEARIATRNALFKGRDKRSMERIPWVTFTDPEVARVGLTLAEAKDAHVHEVKMSVVDRAVCEGDSEGFIRVVVDSRDRILGVHIVGLDAGEALTEWVLAMDHGITLEEIGRSIHVYPTLARANRRVADRRFLEHGVSAWTTKLFGNF